MNIHQCHASGLFDFVAQRWRVRSVRRVTGQQQKIGGPLIGKKHMAHWFDKDKNGCWWPAGRKESRHCSQR
jgi:hypothetical protein